MNSSQCVWGHLTIYHCWPGRGPAAACSHQETSGGGGVAITRSDLRDGLLGQAEADPLLDSAPLGLLGDQDRPLVVVRHPDWSEQGAARAVPGIRVLQATVTLIDNRYTHTISGE